MDPVELWVGKVSLGNSQSEHTKENYRRFMKGFLEFAGITAEKILKDYPLRGNDRAFKQKYADLIFMWMNSLNEKGISPLSIRVRVGAVQSFFKYHNLNLGMIQIPNFMVKFHNRDISKEEIAMVMRASRPRYRAFYSFMAQSGIRPHTILKLRLKHLEPDFSKGVVPCMVKVPQELAKGKYGSYFSFIGQETIDHLRGYFLSREPMSSESLLFCRVGKSTEELSPETISGEFNRVLQTLRKKGRLDYETKEAGKPSELRLYTLRKFFKKFSQQAGEDYNEFWMGHKGGVSRHYISQDPEFHRQLYKEKAMPFLRLEASTPTETEKVIAEQRAEIVRLNEKVNSLKNLAWDADKMLKQVPQLVENSVKKNLEGARTHYLGLLEDFALRLVEKGLVKESDLTQTLKQVMDKARKESSQ